MMRHCVAVPGVSLGHYVQASSRRAHLDQHWQHRPCRQRLFQRLLLLLQRLSGPHRRHLRQCLWLRPLPCLQLRQAAARSLCCAVAWLRPSLRAVAGPLLAGRSAPAGMSICCACHTLHVSMTEPRIWKRHGMCPLRGANRRSRDPASRHTINRRHSPAGHVHASSYMCSLQTVSTCVAAARRCSRRRFTRSMSSSSTEGWNLTPMSLTPSLHTTRPLTVRRGFGTSVYATQGHTGRHCCLCTTLRRPDRCIWMAQACLPSL